MRAGRDLTLTAAQWRSRTMRACKPGGHRPGYAHRKPRRSHRARSRNRHETRSSREIGADIAAGGNLTLVAGQDINARAANVTADQQLVVGAGRDVNLTAGVETAYAYDESYSKRGLLSSKTTHTISSSDQTRAVASTFSGGVAVVSAGGRDAAGVQPDRRAGLASCHRPRHSGAGRGRNHELPVRRSEVRHRRRRGLSIGYNKQERTDWIGRQWRLRGQHGGQHGREPLPGRRP